MADRRAQIVSGFLDWLVCGGYLTANPFAEIRCVCRRQSTAAIVRALVSPDPELALEQIRGLPRFGSHLGPIIQAHVKRIRRSGSGITRARSCASMTSFSAGPVPRRNP